MFRILLLAPTTKIDEANNLRRKTMRINENYRIEPDTQSWNLIFEKIGEINPQTDKPIMSTSTSYHGNLQQACFAYLDTAIKDGAKDVESVLQAIVTAKQELIDALKGAKQ
jgi:hypothetical protein